MRHVLVVEDHPLVAEATARLLTHAFDDVHVVSCGTASGAMERLRDSQSVWSRIFLDLAVPGAFGLSLAKQVRSLGAAPICCVVSAFDRDDYVRQLQAWGFLGYIPKSMPVDAFVARLNDAMRGLGTFPATPRERRSSSIRLTARQTEILELIQQGRSSKQIATLMNLAEGTVNNQVAALLHVLQADSRSHAVAKAIELGLIDVTSSVPFVASQPTLARPAA
ncbi:MAG: response regulator transcription factor [Burkholderiaceae bacterium]|nr:response regulator transcription factor [Burkholderiaceae bacterium]